MFLRFNILGILWALLILVLCSVPNSELPELSWDAFIALDKLAHASLFAVLSLLIIIGLRKQYFSLRLRYSARKIAFLFGSLYGVLIEILQLTLLSGRSFDWLDILADTIGSALGVLAFRVIYGKEFAY